MGTLRIDELEIEGVRSFASRTLIKFPYPGMVLINGRWLDSGVSSGAGKSTIPISIAHALDYCDLPATVLQSRYSKKRHVRLRLIDDETKDTFDVIRNPKLKLEINGKAPEGLSSGHEEKLKEILRVPPDLIKALTYRQQREKGGFLSRTDMQNKEFLSILLNLTKLEAASDDLSVSSGRLSNEINLLNSQIATAQSLTAQAADVASKIPEAEQKYSDALKRYNLLAVQADRPELMSTISSLQSEIARIRQVGNQAAAAQAENRHIRDTITALQSEMDTISNQICPTCRREWDQGQARMDALRERIQSLASKMQANITVISSAAPMQEALPGLQARLDEANRKMGESQAPLADARLSMESSRQYLETLVRQKNHYDSAMKDIEAKQARAATLARESEVDRLAAELLSRNGFLSVIFDEVLKEIEVRANEMIGQMPNVSTFSIQINSTNETKKGTIQKNITTKIFKDGEEVPFKSLSGGQQCSLELFTDLSVSETIKKRSGSPIGWMFLDEAMDGLDVDLKKSALAIIRKHVNGTVVVIDHSTEIKELFDQVIQIEFDGRNSHVTS